MASHTAWDPSARRTRRFKSPTAAAARLGTRRPAARQLRLVESPAPSGCRFSLPARWMVRTAARADNICSADGRTGRSRQAGWSWTSTASLCGGATQQTGWPWMEQCSATACSVWRRFGRGGLSEEQGGSLHFIVRGAQEIRKSKHCPSTSRGLLVVLPESPGTGRGSTLPILLLMSQAGGATPR